MANKGQKHKKYSPEFKEQVLKEYFSGEESPKSLELKFGVPLKTVEMWVYKTKHKKIDVLVDHRSGNSGRKPYKNLGSILQNSRKRYSKSILMD